MNTRPARVTAIVLGIIAVLIGVVWIGQGLNLLPGSSMSGNKMWFYIGLVVAVVGLVALILGLRRPPRPR